MIDQRSPSVAPPVVTSPSYSWIHAQARRSIADACTKCGATGDLHAALRPEAPEENLRTDARSGCLYSVDPDSDYAALCVPCHWQQDQVEAPRTDPSARKTPALRLACKHGHEFTPENTRIVRGVRVCETCRRAAYTKWNAKMQAAIVADPAKRAAQNERMREYMRKRRAAARAAKAVTVPAQRGGAA